MALHAGRTRAAAAIAALLLLAAAPAAAIASPVGDGRGVTLERVATLDRVTYIDDAPGFGELLFVVEQRGTIQVLRHGKPLERPFLDIRDRVRSPEDGGSDEEGLASIAFPPDYERSRRFYVFYSDVDGDIEIDQYRRDTDRATRASADSRRPVLRIAHPDTSVHQGGQLQFGPGGDLYVSTGDGYNGSPDYDTARNPESLLGKLLRIQPRPGGGYSVPSSNPYADGPGRDEIYSYGLRNPWRFTFAKGFRRLAIADVGDVAVEEIDVVRRRDAKGANFGWPQYEGTHLRPAGEPGADPPVPPILEYFHPGFGPFSPYAHGCAIVGGYVARDPALDSLRGRYLYADYCTGRIGSLVPKLDGARDDRALGPRPIGPTTFGEGHRGRLYLGTVTGRVFRLVPKR